MLSEFFQLQYLFAVWVEKICINKYHISLRASDRFIQPIFFRNSRWIGRFMRSHGCGIFWSTVTCMVDLWPRSQSISPNLTSSYPISYMTKFCVEESFKQNGYKISKTDQTLNTKIGVRLLYSLLLHWFYPIRYMVSFWRSDCVFC